MFFRFISFSFLLLRLVSLSLQAQDSNEVGVTYEEVKARCEGRAFEDRARVVVASFRVSVPNRTYELGDNMAVMLTNALQEINCFRVLEMIQNQYESEREGYVGNQPNAQLLITGDITEFSEETKSIGALGFRNNTTIIKLGFILKVVNPATRDILWSKSVNVEGKSSGGFVTGPRIPGLGRLTLAGASKDNPAVANALEQGVLEASRLLVDFVSENEVSAASYTTVVVEGIDYGGMQRMKSTLSDLTGVKAVKPNFDSGTAYLEVTHSGDTQALMDALYGKISRSHQVKAVSAGEIVLRAK
jgi:curli biogenesis system outer membrane secretion channel CsgG